jgi:hypothetical protein
MKINPIVTVHTHVIKKDYAANVYIIILTEMNFQLVSSKMKLKKHMIDLLRIILKITKIKIKYKINKFFKKKLSSFL